MAADFAPVPVFARRFPAPGEAVVRIGNGALGGKGTSLVRAQREILARLSPADTADVVVDVPASVVLTADVFDAFVEYNGLRGLLDEDVADERLARLFQKATLPPAVLGDLRALAMQARAPLAVRSSSLLEDALSHPFAGIYATKMIPSSQLGTADRFRRLAAAIKTVYASTWSRGARRYARAAGQSPAAEKMAVVLQEVVGARHGGRFYPNLSGVARSFDYYPTGRSRPDDGVVYLALGLGRAIVEGGLTWPYNPRWPARPPPYGSVQERVANTQTRFWAVHMGRPPLPDPARETEYLVESGLEVAESDGVPRYVASTWDPGADRLLPGAGHGGPRVLDFAPILHYDELPLNRVVRRLLHLSEDALGCAVEIEFAATFGPDRGLPLRFGFLQVRPMAVSSDVIDLSDEPLAGPGVLVGTEAALGNGHRADIEDIVYVVPEAFQASATREVAQELERVDARLRAVGHPYLLIGFGRWGSSDPWLGIPVAFHAVSGARVIVEAALPGMNPDPSQGSHFFQNLIAFQVLYLTVREREAVDWAWLARLPAEWAGRWVRHVRTSQPLLVRADGRNGRGVVRHHE